MKRHIISIDPGDVRNGFCYFVYNTETKTADTKIMKICSQHGVRDLLKVVWGITQVKTTSDIDEALAKPEVFFVCENFRVDSKVRGAMFQWSEMETVRMIGAVQLAAEWSEAPFILQEPGSVFPMAHKWAPFKMTKHPRDDHAAWCHGVKFMMGKNWIRTPDQVTLFGQEKL